MGMFAYQGENLVAKELNIPKWVWRRGWSYSNFAMRKIDRYDKRRKTAHKGLPDNDCR